MNILAVDDEKILLNELIRELQVVFPEANIHGETSSVEALEWSKQLQALGEHLDYAFLDIKMKEFNGLQLALELKKLFPRTSLIFCTAYTEYAFDAIGMYAKGYLIKPISADKIIQTLDEMVYDWRNTKNTLPRDIRMQTFGHFEVFVDGCPLVFEREKAKELLAYLVDRHGATVTTKQIATVLWEDRPYDRTMKNYVSTVLSSLRATLRAVDVEDILIKTRNHLAINTSKIKCDAYDYEQWDLAAVNSFKGEYMVNYSWAEFTTGKYVDMELGNHGK